ncbi:hypothetical protein L2E82_01958 [Cichorium intybus]|uniref:Uncharacterized protein n=1 Tax=Cichorium intybus TaxID=13427 RepID=A0ACB9H0F2_CICIN|nr:hypothetical protein L2E82_01958 [Cichorium intybus]
MRLLHRFLPDLPVSSSSPARHRSLPAQRRRRSSNSIATPPLVVELHCSAADSRLSLRQRSYAASSRCILFFLLQLNSYSIDSRKIPTTNENQETIFDSVSSVPFSHKDS